MQLKEAWEFYIKTNPRIKSHSTVKHYNSCYRQLCKFSGRTVEFTDLNDDFAHGWSKWLLGNGLAEPTVNQKLSYLRAFWNWAAKRRYIDRFPTFQNIDEPEPDTQTWTDDEVQRMFTACDNLSGRYMWKVNRSDWWRAYLAFHLETGERTSAVFSTQWSWFSGEKLVYPPDVRKGKKKRSFHIIRPEVMQLLEPLRAFGTPQIFNFPSWRMGETPPSYYSHFRTLLKSAGLPHDRKKLGQCLRRRTINWLILADGIDTARRAATHSSARVTEKYYEDPRLTRTDGFSKHLPKFIG